MLAHLFVTVVSFLAYRAFLKTLRTRIFAWLGVEEKASLFSIAAGARLRDLLIFKQNLEVQLAELILEPLRACRDHPQRPEWPKVILIDGLDECEADHDRNTTRRNTPPRSNEDDQTEILSALKKAASDPDFPFRIVIASPPEHAIRTFFSMGLVEPKV